MRNIMHSGVVKNLMFSLTSTSSIFLIQLCTTPIITRLYDPDDYGEFSLFNSILSCATIFSFLALNDALLVTKKEKDFKNIAITILYNSFLFSVFFYAALLLLFFLNIIEISWWYYFIPVFVIIQSLTEIIDKNYVVKNQFKRKTEINVSSSLGSRFFAISFGFFSKASSYGLILSEFLRNLIVLSISYDRVKEVFKRRYFKKMAKTALHSLKKWASFPKYSYPGNIINQSSNYFIVWYIASFFSSTELGYFSLASTIINIPIIVIGNAIRPVLFNELKVFQANPKNKVKIGLSLLAILILLALLNFSAFYFFSVEIFASVFGNEWSYAGTVATILVIYTSLNFISGPTSVVFYIFDKQKVFFYFFVFMFCCRISTFAIAYTCRFDFIETLWLYCIFNVMIYLVQIYLELKIYYNNIHAKV